MSARRYLPYGGEGLFSFSPRSAMPPLFGESFFFASFGFTGRDSMRSTVERVEETHTRNTPELAP